MSAVVSCPGCGVGGELPDDALGGLLGCPRCGTQFTSPGLLRPARAPGGQARSSDPTPPSLTGEPVATDVMDELSVWVGPIGPDDTPPPSRTLSARTLPHLIRPPTRGGDGSSTEVTAETAAAHLDWLRQEVERFNRFVAQQFEQIQKAREETALAATRTAAAFVTREQELNLRQASAAARTAAVEQRQEQDFANRRAELERRLAEVERLEASVRRRLYEADEVEAALCAALEDREREVEVRRRPVEEEASRFRSETSPLADELPD